MIEILKGSSPETKGEKVTEIFNFIIEGVISGSIAGEKTSEVLQQIEHRTGKTRGELVLKAYEDKELVTPSNHKGRIQVFPFDEQDRSIFVSQSLREASILELGDEGEEERFAVCVLLNPSYNFGILGLIGTPKISVDVIKQVIMVTSSAQATIEEYRINGELDLLISGEEGSSELVRHLNRKG